MAKVQKTKEAVEIHGIQDVQKMQESPAAGEPVFRMIDVGRKRVTRRRAVACGSIRVGASALEKIRGRSLPKGDVLALAEVAGILGAKKTSDLLPLCHPLSVDEVMVRCVCAVPDRVEVFTQVVAHAKTGVEMEAVVAVQAALATIWDLVKGTEPNLTIEGVRLLLKEGGKSGVWINPDGIPTWLAAQLPEGRSLEGVQAAVLVMSDRASSGVYEDKSGLVLRQALEAEGAQVAAHLVVPDTIEDIIKALRQIGESFTPSVVLASGGTGPGPRDVTPEALRQVCSRMLDGLGELLRRESAVFTDTAWLSRMTAGMMGGALVIALPGSPKAIVECWEVLRPFLGRALTMVQAQGYAGRS